MAPFDQLQKRRAESERGAILVLTALVILLLLFIAAFSTDLGAWYRQTEEQQRAADVGSLNGISAYDRGVKQVFSANGGVDTWQELALRPGGAALLQDAERDGLIEATLTVQALLETSGLTFTSAPTFTIASDPLDPNSTSTVELIAQDGSIVTITRSFVQTGVASDGVTPTYTRAIDVTIERTGEQYFSNIIREAPQIERSAQSLLSNCGATCDNPVTFNPPFVAFKGSGNGDGYGPLLYDRPSDDDGDGVFTQDGIIDEAWAVNHHSSGTTTGQIICVEVETQDPCPGHNAPNQAFALDYQTGNRPVEYIDPVTGNIYFAARNRGNGALGLACWSAQNKDYCGDEFISFWTQTTNAQYPAWINATGPFHYAGRLYIVAQNGTVACATLAMDPCTIPGPYNVGSSDTSALPGLNSGNYITNGEQNGQYLILTQNSNSGVLFRCLDLSRVDTRATDCGQHLDGSLARGDDNLTFTRFNTAGAPVGVCTHNIISENTGCVDWNANVQTPVNLNLGLLGQSWGGDAFTWQGATTAQKRTFFAGGNSNYIGCYNWETNAPCNDGPDGGGAYLLANAAYSGITDVNPYSFAQISDRCVIALGHRAVFISFDPVGFGPCVDVKITTTIQACDCADESAGTRWGPLSLPPALLADVEFLDGTIRNVDGSLVTDGAGNVLPEFENPIDLIASGGVIDLSILNDLAVPPGELQLTLEADSKLDSSGNPLFANPYTTNLAITVQPTLSQ